MPPWPRERPRQSFFTESTAHGFLPSSSRSRTQPRRCQDRPETGVSCSRHIRWSRTRGVGGRGVSVPRSFLGEFRRPRKPKDPGRWTAVLGYQLLRDAKSIDSKVFMRTQIPGTTNCSRFYRQNRGGVKRRSCGHPTRVDTVRVTRGLSARAFSQIRKIGGRLQVLDLARSPSVAATEFSVPDLLSTTGTSFARPTEAFP